LAEYALRDVAKPIGVSTYRVTRELPALVRDELPTVEDLQEVVTKFRSEMEQLRKERQEYRTTMDHLSPSTINVRLSAIRKLVGEARRNGMIDLEEATDLSDIPNVRQKGTRLGNWLPDHPSPSKERRRYGCL